MTQKTALLGRRIILAGMAGALAAPGIARAQAFPTRPLRLVVPFPPAGTTDIAGRIMAERLSARIGQPIIVETAQVLREISALKWSSGQNLMAIRL